MRLLEQDPDLLNGVPDGDATRAIEHSTIRLGAISSGQWLPSEEKNEPDVFGLYVVDGVLARSVTVGERTCAEVIGPGDILRPWVRAESGSASIESSIEWTVVGEATLGVLDGAFLRRMAGWPAVISALGDRVMLRTHWLAFHLAVCHMRRVDERLLIVLWHFADRWGRVTPSGTIVPLPFTHALLAKVVGAQRPTVSGALSELQRGGYIERAEDRTWILHGEAPEDLVELRNRPTGSGRIEPHELED